MIGKIRNILDYKTQACKIQDMGFNSNDLGLPGAINISHLRRLVGRGVFNSIMMSLRWSLA